MLLESLNEIQEYLKIINSNPMLVAGMGTVGFGSVIYALKKVPQTIADVFLKVFTVKFHSNSNSGQHPHIEKVLMDNIFNISKKSFQTKSVTHGLARMGVGNSYGLFKGTFFKLSTSFHKSNDGHFVTELDVTFLTLNNGIVKKLFSSADIAEEESLSMGGIPVTMGNSSDNFIITKRYMETVFIPTNIKEQIINKIDWFISNKQFFQQRGLPYKLVILLHGEPGTGKTSLIRAIGTKYNKALNYHKSFSSLLGWKCYETHQRINIMEDVDCMGDSSDALDREDNEVGSRSGGKVSLSEILNKLDGVLSEDGEITIMTTNHIDKLDKAFLRAGRIDLIVELPKLDENTFKEMFLSFHDQEALKLLENELKTKKFIPATGAKVQELFLKHSGNLDGIFKEILE